MVGVKAFVKMLDRTLELAPPQDRSIVGAQPGGHLRSFFPAVLPKLTGLDVKARAEPTQGTKLGLGSSARQVPPEVHQSIVLDARPGFVFGTVDDAAPDLEAVALDANLDLAVDGAVVHDARQLDPAEVELGPLAQLRKQLGQQLDHFLSSEAALTRCVLEPCANQAQMRQRVNPIVDPHHAVGDDLGVAGGGVDGEHEGLALLAQ